jgi:hypothetical protein
MKRILIIPVLILVAAPAFADPIPKSPGWSLSEIEQDENSYGGATNYTLRPPKGPAITIDYATAAKIKNQEVRAEDIYAKDPTVPKADFAAMANDASPVKTGPGAAPPPPGDGDYDPAGAAAQAAAAAGQADRKPASPVDLAPANMNEAQKSVYSKFLEWKNSKDRELPEAPAGQ